MNESSLLSLLCFHVQCTMRCMDCTRGRFHWVRRTFLSFIFNILHLSMLHVFYTLRKFYTVHLAFYMLHS